jgi:hypothetical protein
MRGLGFEEVLEAKPWNPQTMVSAAKAFLLRVRFITGAGAVGRISLLVGSGRLSKKNSRSPNCGVDILR